MWQFEFLQLFEILNFHFNISVSKNVDFPKKKRKKIKLLANFDNRIYLKKLNLNCVEFSGGCSQMVFSPTLIWRIHVIAFVFSAFEKILKVAAD